MGELRFDGRTAIVTGAGGNPSLGRAHALLLGARGANVVVNDIGRDPEAKGYTGAASAEAVAAEIRAAGGKAIANTDSVATEEGAAALIQSAVDAFGSIDILVNNAAVAAIADFDEISSRDFMRHVEVNIMGSVWTCRAAWPHMKRQNYGRIVNIGSGAMGGLSKLVAYSLSKGAVFSLTRSLAAEGRAFGIKVNTLNPAAYTRMLESQQEEDSSLLLSARANTPAEIVSPAVAWLAHEDCPVTGECINAAGGLFGRVVLSETPGLFDREATIETLRDQWPTVMDDITSRRVDAGQTDINEWHVKPYAQ